MISTLKTTLLIAFLAIAMIPSSFAKPMESITTFVKENTISLFLGSYTDEQLQVKISDMNGEILMTEKLVGKEINERKYNLKNLPDGEYVLEIDDNEKIVAKKFAIINKDITMLSEEVLEIPSVFKKDDRWIVGVLTFGKSAVVTIYDDKGNEILSEAYDDEVSISRKYNLSNLEYGEYTLKVEVGGKAFYDRMIIS